MIDDGSFNEVVRNLHQFVEIDRLNHEFEAHVWPIYSMEIGVCKVLRKMGINAKVKYEDS